MKVSTTKIVPSCENCLLGGQSASVYSDDKNENWLFCSTSLSDCTATRQIVGNCNHSQFGVNCHLPGD